MFNKQSARITLLMGLGVVIGVSGTSAFAGGKVATCPPSGKAIKGNVEIPAGLDCVISGGSINGNVSVKGGLVLTRMSVNGNVMADHADYLGIGGDAKGGSTVTGNVHADHLTGAVPKTNSTFGENYLCNTVIGGNVEIHESSANSPWRIGQPDECVKGALHVAGNLQFDENDAEGLISKNHIGGNLECEDNSPPPSGTPGSNVVAGKKQEQCDGL